MSNFAKKALTSTVFLGLALIASPLAAQTVPNTETSQSAPSPTPEYGCISGYENGTYQGNRAVTRYEFAAGLNACLNQIDRQLENRTPGTQATREDFNKLVEQMNRNLQELRNLNSSLETIESSPIYRR